MNKEMHTLLNDSDIEELESNQYSLRPQTLDEFIGQEQIKEQLRIHIEAAKSRNQALAHILFVGAARPGEDHIGSDCCQRNGQQFQVSSWAHDGTLGSSDNVNYPRRKGNLFY